MVMHLFKSYKIIKDFLIKNNAKFLLNFKLKKKLDNLNKNIQSNNKLPLSVIQYDETDIINCLDTLTRGWPTIG